ncbi:MAG: serine acetyltransferase [Desulfovibrionaceae bacterium]|nr:serine acetyltransferase [Desulfovibrionaceae bacterium]
MNKDKALAGMDRLTAELLTPAFYEKRFDLGVRMPSLPVLEELMQRLRAVFFPGYYSFPQTWGRARKYHLSANLDSIYRLLAGQIENGYCLEEADEGIAPCRNREAEAFELAEKFMQKLPEIRSALESDVRAAYEGDPAARSPGETIFCYPSIRAMTNHRIAYQLYLLNVPLVPRIIAEMAHGETGIDIHPGARIGDSFFIDHGTGVVIGETCIIGRNCRLYQGVTLGALSFPKEEDGSLTKGLPRHPILEDDVVVYSGATILGRVTIGQGSMIGGNVWITKNIAPGSKVVQHESTTPESGESLLG